MVGLIQPAQSICEGGRQRSANFLVFLCLEFCASYFKGFYSRGRAHQLFSGYGCYFSLSGRHCTAHLLTVLCATSDCFLTKVINA